MPFVCNVLFGNRVQSSEQNQKAFESRSLFILPWRVAGIVLCPPILLSSPAHLVMAFLWYHHHQNSSSHVPGLLFSSLPSLPNQNHCHRHHPDRHNCAERHHKPPEYVNVHLLFFVVVKQRCQCSSSGWPTADVIRHESVERGRRRVVVVFRGGFRPCWCWFWFWF